MKTQTTVAVIGGGQLGRMMALEAPRLSIRMKCLDPNGSAAPCAGISEDGGVEGSLKDPKALKKLAEGVDVVTAEIEHISVPALEEVSVVCSGVGEGRGEGFIASGT